MKKLLLIAGLLFTFFQLFSQESALWMRYPAISPDGTQIVFTYKGDIFKVSANGGRAMQLTSHPAHDTNPVWSPDGSSIAFGSDREGSFDVYTMSADGGSPKRLTTYSGNEYPITFRDSEHILFSARILPDQKYQEFPSGVFSQVYEVSTTGQRPILYSSLTMENIAFSKDKSKLLYHDKKGYEDPWRKHHVSSIARDIWLSDNGKYTKMTTFRGEDRNPVWTSDEKGFYYLSEKNKSFNIYKKEFASGSDKQLTDFSSHPVRFLSSSDNGVLCFGYDGEIYTLTNEKDLKKVDVRIVADDLESIQKRMNFSSNVSEMILSPNDKEIAFIIRGDVYVASVEYGTTRRITNTPEQERNLSFSPDGKNLVYASERNGIWNIYQTSLAREDDKYFLYAKEYKEIQLTDGSVPSFRPLYSPDGKEIAYLEDRTTIKVLNLESKNTRTVLEGKYNYSYSDGDQWFRWSPDSRWILAHYIGIGGWNNRGVALIKADGSNEVTDLTESGYTDSAPRFIQDGKAMLWFSDRAGYRSHGSWGAQDDAYVMFFDRSAYDKFRMNKEELALLKEESDAKEKEKAKDKDKDKTKAKAKKDKKSIEPLKFDLKNRKDMVIRLTPNSSFLTDAYLNKKGEKLYYITPFEKGYDLWEHNLKDKSSKILAKDVGASMIQVDSAENNILLLSKGTIKKISLNKGETKVVGIKAEFDYQPSAERQYMYDHIWRQIKDKFYVKDLHNVDWDMYHTAYKRFLPHINNNHDFSEMLSEMLGELNASHTGARYFKPSTSVPTASLGAFYDLQYSGDGLKISEILNMGPLSVADSKVQVGSIITKIDGVVIEKGKDYYPLLAGKAGKKVLLSYKKTDSSAEEELWIKAISLGEQDELLYKRWVEQRREMVDKLSEGRVGYVHVRGMNSSSFREVYSELLGRCRNKESVIIDTRHNGGGWLHDDLVTLLGGKEYQRFEPRGQYIGSDPYNKWLKPSVVLVCEDNYSNAHGFPWLYKELKVGKVIGAPVPGTMTAVWWESQIDPSIVFGVPQVAVKDMRGNYLENQELAPDIEVYNTPETVLDGKDLQLEKAVKVLLNR